MKTNTTAHTIKTTTTTTTTKQKKRSIPKEKISKYFLPYKKEKTGFVSKTTTTTIKTTTMTTIYGLTNDGHSAHDAIEIDDDSENDDDDDNDASSISSNKSIKNHSVVDSTTKATTKDDEINKFKSIGVSSSSEPIDETNIRGDENAEDNRDGDLCNNSTNGSNVDRGNDDDEHNDDNHKSRGSSIVIEISDERSGCDDITSDDNKSKIRSENDVHSSGIENKEMDDMVTDSMSFDPKKEDNIKDDDDIKSTSCGNPSINPKIIDVDLENIDDDDDDNDDERHHPTSSTNPFTAFSFDPNSSSQTSQKLTITKRLPFPNATVQHSKTNSSSTIIPPPPRRQRRTSPSSSSKPSTPTTTVKLIDLSPSDHHRLRLKWHSFSNPSSPLEHKRFQLLVAARLHARTNETVVRRAMTTLHRVFSSSKAAAAAESANDETVPKPNGGGGGGGFCVTAMATMDPSSLGNMLSYVHFANSKSRQIVMAANDILNDFGGVVPEKEEDLKRITGIGPKFAELLSLVNTKEAHTNLVNGGKKDVVADEEEITSLKSPFWH